MQGQRRGDLEPALFNIRANVLAFIHTVIRSNTCGGK